MPELNIDELENELDEENFDGIGMPETEAEAFEEETLDDIEFKATEANLDDVRQYFNALPNAKYYFYLSRKFISPSNNQPTYGKIWTGHDEWIDDSEIQRRYGGGQYKLQWVHHYAKGKVKNFTRNFALEGKSLDPVIWNEQEKQRKLLAEGVGQQTGAGTSPLQMFEMLQANKKDNMQDFIAMSSLFNNNNNSNNNGDMTQMMMLMMKQSSESADRQMQMLMTILPLIMQKPEKDVSPYHNVEPMLKMFEKGIQLAGGQVEEVEADDSKAEMVKLIGGGIGALMKAYKNNESKSASEKPRIKVESIKNDAASDVLKNLKKEKPEKIVEKTINKEEVQA